MKLQLALDMLSTQEALNMVEKTENYIDIIEVGTPLIKHEGIRVVEKLRAQFPKKKILVDLKTMDVGEYESNFCFQAGADIVTVLGVADIDTIRGSIRSAENNGGEVVVDLINVKNKIERAKEILTLSNVHLGVHTGIDQQNRGETPLKNLKELSILNSSIFVAGGINLNNIDKIILENPYAIVVGGAITGSDNPRLVAKEIKKRMQQRVSYE